MQMAPPALACSANCLALRTCTHDRTRVAIQPTGKRCRAHLWAHAQQRRRVQRLAAPAAACRCAALHCTALLAAGRWEGARRARSRDSCCPGSLEVPSSPCSRPWRASQHALPTSSRPTCRPRLEAASGKRFANGGVAAAAARHCADGAHAHTSHTRAGTWLAHRMQNCRKKHASRRLTRRTVARTATGSTSARSAHWQECCLVFTLRCLEQQCKCGVRCR